MVAGGGAVLFADFGEIVRGIDDGRGRRLVGSRRLRLGERRQRHLARLDLRAHRRPEQGDRTNRGDDEDPVHIDTRANGESDSQYAIHIPANRRFSMAFLTCRRRHVSADDKAALSIAEW